MKNNFFEKSKYTGNTLLKCKINALLPMTQSCVDREDVPFQTNRGRVGMITNQSPGRGWCPWVWSLVLALTGLWVSRSWHFWASVSHLTSWPTWSSAEAEMRRMRLEAKHCWWLQKPAEKREEETPSEPPEGTSPADTSTSGFWPPGLWGNKSSIVLSHEVTVICFSSCRTLTHQANPINKYQNIHGQLYFFWSQLHT